MSVKDFFGDIIEHRTRSIIVLIVSCLISSILILTVPQTASSRPGTTATYILDFYSRDSATAGTDDTLRQAKQRAAQLIKTSPVLKEISYQTGISTPTLDRQIRVEPNGETSLRLECTRPGFVSASAQQATDCAQIGADVFTKFWDSSGTEASENNSVSPEARIVGVKGYELPLRYVSPSNISILQGTEVVIFILSSIIIMFLGIQVMLEIIKETGKDQGSDEIDAK